MKESQALAQGVLSVGVIFPQYKYWTKIKNEHSVLLLKRYFAQAWNSNIIFDSYQSRNRTGTYLKHIYKNIHYICVCVYIYAYIHMYMVLSSASEATEIVELLGRLLQLAKTWTSTVITDLQYHVKYYCWVLNSCALPGVFSLWYYLPRANWFDYKW